MPRTLEGSAFGGLVPAASLHRGWPLAFLPFARVAVVAAVGVVLLGPGPVEGDIVLGANVRVDDTGPYTQQTVPALAGDAAGRFFAVWQDDRGGSADFRLPPIVSPGQTTAILEWTLPIRFADNRVKSVGRASLPACLADEMAGTEARPTGVLSSNRIGMEWTTEEPATSEVEYGTSQGSYGQLVRLGSFATRHQVVLTGLSPGTTHHYRLGATDPSGNAAAKTADLTLTTTQGLPIPRGSLVALAVVLAAACLALTSRPRRRRTP